MTSDSRTADCKVTIQILIISHRQGRQGTSAALYVPVAVCSTQIHSFKHTRGRVIHFIIITAHLNLWV